MRWELNSDFTLQRVGDEKIFANSVATVIYRLTGDVLINDLVNINLVVNGITYNYNMLLDTDGSFYAISNGDELKIDSNSETEMRVSFEIKKLSMLDNETIISTQTTQQDTVLIYPSAKYVAGEIATDVDKINAEINVVNNRLVAHINDKNNPHEVTKEQVGLGNADNTSDADKPLSNAQKTYIDNSVSAVPYVLDFKYDANTGVLTIQTSDMRSYSVDLPLELIVKSGYYDYETYQLVLTLANNEEIRIALESIVTNNENIITNSTVNYTYSDIDGVKVADYVEIVIPSSVKLFDNVRYTFDFSADLSWFNGISHLRVELADTTPVYVKHGETIIELKTPYDRKVGNRCIAEYISQLQYTEKNTEYAGYTHVAYRFSGLIKNNEIIIDMENLESIKEYVTESLGTIDTQLQELNNGVGV